VLDRWLLFLYILTIASNYAEFVIHSVLQVHVIWHILRGLRSQSYKRCFDSFNLAYFTISYSPSTAPVFFCNFFGLKEFYHNIWFFQLSSSCGVLMKLGYISVPLWATFTLSSQLYSLGEKFCTRFKSKKLNKSSSVNI